MSELEYFVGFKIKRELTKKTLNISQPYLTNNMTEGFNENMKSPLTFNTSATPYKGIVKYSRNRHKNIIQSTIEKQEWRRIATIPFQSQTYQVI